MKRILALGLSLLLAVGVLATSVLAEDENVTLVVTSFYNTGSSSGWDGLVAAFTEKHPNVTLEVQETANGDDYLTKLVSSLAAGEAPDVIAMENKWVAKFVGSGLLAPLNDYIANDPDLKLEDFYPHLMERYTVDGNIYGLPYDAQPTCMFFYNKALFDAEGLEYPTDEWTWDDMLAAATKLTKTDESGRTTQWGLLANSWYNYLYSNGGTIFNEDETECLMNTPEAIGGIQFLVDLIQKYKVMPDPTTLNSMGVGGADLFATGQLAMLCCGYWDLVFQPTRWDDIDLGLTWFPANPEGNHGWDTGGTAYCVANGSKHPDLAYEFVKYFMTEPGWEAAYHASINGVIYPPAHIPSYEKFVLNNPDLKIPNVEINGKAVPYAHFAPMHPLYTEISSKIIEPTIEEMELGYISVEDGMQDITERVNEALETGEVY